MKPRRNLKLFKYHIKICNPTRANKKEPSLQTAWHHTREACGLVGASAVLRLARCIHFQAAMSPQFVHTSDMFSVYIDAPGPYFLPSVITAGLLQPGLKDSLLLCNRARKSTAIGRHVPARMGCIRTRLLWRKKQVSPCEQVVTIR